MPVLGLVLVLGSVRGWFWCSAWEFLEVGGGAKRPGAKLPISALSL